MSYFSEANTGGSYGGRYAARRSSTTSAAPRSSTAQT
jgi:hypothetical protein